MSLTLISLIVVLVLAVATIVYTVVANRERAAIVSRVGGTNEERARMQTSVLKKVEDEDSIVTRLAEYMPSSAANDTRFADKLVQAGYDNASAPVIYSMIRLAVLIFLPLLAFLIAPRDSYTSILMYVGGALVFAWIAPMAMLDRKVRQRQEEIRRSIPDALDLLVVCVEAGISLDAAVLRVAREIGMAHPLLSRELIIVNRKTNAGMPRDEALRGLWARTGVEDLRTLVSSMVQSEKWGTSIATVLRVSAETLRRKRRQTAEKKAAQAPLKMTMPLVGMVLPALFIVILGPAAVLVIDAFSNV